MSRWNLSVDDTTDQNLRAFLGQRGAKKGALSKFVDEAVLEKIFAETVKSVKERNVGVNEGDITAAINEALEEARAGRS